MINEFLDDAEVQMKKAVNALETDFRKVRTGRANTALLDGLTVNYYGVPTPINQVASVSAPEGRLLMIKPWDKTVLKAIERAILESNLGFNPNNDGKVIRLVMPQLTKESRKKLVKQVGKRTETAKVSVRSARRDTIKDLKDAEKESMITEDDLRRAQDKIQKLTDKYITMADGILKDKEEEIMEI